MECKLLCAESFWPVEYLSEEKYVRTGGGGKWSLEHPWETFE